MQAVVLVPVSMVYDSQTEVQAIAAEQLGAEALAARSAVTSGDTFTDVDVAKVAFEVGHRISRARAGCSTPRPT